MFNTMQLAGLVGFNVLLLILAVVAFRLIGVGRQSQAGSGRRRAAASDEMFSFDSWSSGPTAATRPMTDGRRIERDGR